MSDDDHQDDDDAPDASRTIAAPPPGFMRLDARRANFVTSLGRKGSGKSVLCGVYFRSFPGDRMVIDPTGDALPRRTLPEDVDPRREVLRVYRGDPPDTWPHDPEGRRVTVRFVPDPARSTFVEDMDRAVGVAYAHRGTCLWLDEIGDVCQVNRVHPHMRRALHQGRHQDLTLLMAGPRPIDVDPMVLSQADVLCAFAFSNPKDRERLAEHFDLSTPPTPRQQMDALMTRVKARGRYAFLALDRRTDPETIGVMAPIGERLAGAVHRGDLWQPEPAPPVPHPEMPAEGARVTSGDVL